ncbi:MAG: alpha/beta hydrolase [Planctomycetes bacterium]|nr:alpha/beta hydrolase [Planctomycetota bacterium]
MGTRAFFHVAVVLVAVAAGVTACGGGDGVRRGAEAPCASPPTPAGGAFASIPARRASEPRAAPASAAQESVEEGYFRTGEGDAAGGEAFWIRRRGGVVVSIRAVATFLREASEYRLSWDRAAGEGGATRFRVDMEHMRTPTGFVEVTISPVTRAEGRGGFRAVLRETGPVGEERRELAVGSDLIIDTHFCSLLAPLFDEASADGGAGIDVLLPQGRAVARCRRAAPRPPRLVEVAGGRYRLDHAFFAVGEAWGINAWRDGDGRLARVTIPADGLRAELLHTLAPVAEAARLAALGATLEENAARGQPPVYAPPTGQAAGEEPRPVFRERLVTFAGACSRLAGTLTLPAEGAEPPFPAAALLHDALLGDRDGNQPPAEPGTLRDLARGLAERGVATLRFDRRGVGESESCDPPARLEQDVADARRALGYLRVLSEVNADRLAFVGLGFGAAVALEAARREEPPPAGVALLTPVGRRWGEAVVAQQRHVMRLQGASAEEVEAAVLKEEALHRDLLAWNPSAPEGAAPAVPSAAYLRDVLLVDPVAAARAARGRALIVGAGRDPRAGLEDARLLAREMEAAKATADLALFDDLDQALAPCAFFPSPADAHDAGRALDARVIDRLSSWFVGTK